MYDGPIYRFKVFAANNIDFDGGVSSKDQMKKSKWDEIYGY